MTASSRRPTVDQLKLIYDVADHDWIQLVDFNAEMAHKNTTKFEISVFVQSKMPKIPSSLFEFNRWRWLNAEVISSIERINHIKAQSAAAWRNRRLHTFFIWTFFMPKVGRNYDCAHSAISGCRQTESQWLRHDGCHWVDFARFFLYLNVRKNVEKPKLNHVAAYSCPQPFHGPSMMSCGSHKSSQNLNDRR